MRILINDHAGHPPQVQLSRALAQKGHDVLHTYTAELQTPRGALSKRSGDPPNLSIRGIPLSKPFDRYGLANRFVQERELGRALQIHAREFQPDVVVSANAPLAAQKALLSAAHQMGAGFVFWLQDMLGIGIKRNLKKKLPVIGNAIGNYFIHLEKTLLAESDAVVAITEDFVPIVMRAGVPRGKIHVTYNWAPLEDMPFYAKTNTWSQRHGLDQMFCFLYSGTLGMKHNPAFLVDLALKFQKHENIRIVVITEGLGAEYLVMKKNACRLDNLLIFPFQSFEDLPMALAAADVLIAILEPDASVFAVPSKVLTYLCTQRPLLLALPSDNLAARTVEKAEAGIVVSSTNTAAFLQASEKLANNAELRKTLAANGRQYALVEFDIQKIADRFEDIFGKIHSANLMKRNNLNAKRVKHC
jgi:colanic acid biosynthesis glycosyl transferase WcaI